MENDSCVDLIRSQQIHVGKYYNCDKTIIVLYQSIVCANDSPLKHNTLSPVTFVGRCFPSAQAATLTRLPNQIIGEVKRSRLRKTPKQTY
jgi:hypothetical protein